METDELLVGPGGAAGFGMLVMLPADSALRLFALGILGGEFFCVEWRRQMTPTVTGMQRRQSTRKNVFRRFCGMPFTIL